MPRPLPSPDIQSGAMLSARAFVDQIACTLGAAPDHDRIVPGRIVRFSVNGKRGNDAGWCKIFEDGEAGVFGNWQTGERHTWHARPSRPHDPEDRRRQLEAIAATQASRAEEEAQRHARAAETAKLIWTNAQPCCGHKYLERKHVAPDGVRVQFGNAAECKNQFFSQGQPLRGLLLLIPVRDAERRLWSLQAIDDAGYKSFLKAGRTRGLFHVAGSETLRQCAGREDQYSERIAIAEGYATARSVFDLEGWPCFIAFNSGNLVAVARNVRAKFPLAPITICGDNDASGVGQRAAEEAGAAIDAMIATPPFTREEITEGRSDWNDYAALLRAQERMAA